MNGVLIVADGPDAEFASEVRAQTRDLAVEIAPALPPNEQRTVLLIWSAASAISATDSPVLIELWSHNRLVIARRDATPLPLGLGDLAAIPPEGSAQEAALQLLSTALTPDASAPDKVLTTPPSIEMPPPRLERAARRSGDARQVVIVPALIIIPLIMILIYFGADIAGWLKNSWASLDASRTESAEPTANTLSTTPSELGGTDEDAAKRDRLQHEIDKFRAALAAGSNSDDACKDQIQYCQQIKTMRVDPHDPIRDLQRQLDEARAEHEKAQRELIWSALAVAAVVVLLAAGSWQLLRRRRTATAAIEKAKVVASAAQTLVPLSELLFVSYSHLDLLRVDPVVSEIEAMGRPVWMDRQGVTGGSGWAGQIARAIKGSRAVVLMASQSAYASDQVVRELYLAMNAKKLIVPIELEPATLPDELEYILAPFQRHALTQGVSRAVLERALERL